jgi:hypothetical protein
VLGVSIRENIELYPGDLELAKYLKILAEDFGLQDHPAQHGAFMAEGLPFYAPRKSGDHVSILGFNKIPLPDCVIEALVDHPEFAEGSMIIRWTQEQDLILECTLADLRHQLNKDHNQLPNKSGSA